jgi:hypothetical protein
MLRRLEWLSQKEKFRNHVAGTVGLTTHFQIPFWVTARSVARPNALTVSAALAVTTKGDLWWRRRTPRSGTKPLI